ncbi:glutathione S-transferase family protein [Deefgea rivuli]|uniref:glutathione S-transferase family protein n=1 Tax=Deefgea rivuli TaxID=400948 RepID=UPI000488C833|nr:glutathione S-transferase family protein [Deefgea rivuli]
MKLLIGNKNYSSWSLRPWLGLKVAGIAFDEQMHNLYAANARDERLQFAPTAKVPVLIDDEITIWETLAIAEYIAERFPLAKLWPHDVAARAHARTVCAEMHAGFVALRTACPMDCRSRKSATMSAEVQADVDRIVALWADCRERFGIESSEGEFLFGHFTWADAFFAPVVTRLVTYGIEVPAAATLYMNTVLALPAMQEWLAAAEVEPWTAP